MKVNTNVSLKGNKKGEYLAIRIKEGLRDRFKQICVDNNISMSKLITRFIKQVIEDNEKGINGA